MVSDAYDGPMIRMALLVAVAVLAAPSWTEQQSGVTARFRGISAFSDRVAWASVFKSYLCY